MQHVFLYLSLVGILQSDIERVTVPDNILPLPHPTRGFVVCQSRHVADEHDVQQVDLKSPSVLPTAEALFLRSKNMFLSLPPLHFAFPVITLVAAHIVPVQHWASEQVAALPGQWMEPASVRFVIPDEQVWDEHLAWDAQHTCLYLSSEGILQSDDSKTGVVDKYLPLPHPTKGFVVCQSRHVADEHDVQQLVLKASSAPPYAEAPFLRSKNMFLSLPALHCAFPVITLVAEHIVPVSVQHVAIEQVLSEAPAHQGSPVLPLYAVGHEYCPLTTAVNARKAKVATTKAIAMTRLERIDKAEPETAPV